ncbi:hypothetical protein HN807_03610 [Candidatus Bathyarchaeota archaeon]|jgi:hypothetical protein|nr:hypothetical protein [Candidatus Bathyarchaeota archaeon]MBT4321106.1 hypothetical protein [Candidatus Bathyarchaeota archaeon]MBT5642715.1 hypothetical protein [Candidatus Bathyarchaeota archaeon]MBT6603556.1 hypothetical protein [Candidatus Bathyarchaeota archaeon]MBT7346152.1 hypothetical protein [Candidatus Bathyarchaeota archaeon]
MSNLGYSSVIHMVGLGGAGTNIVEHFLKNEKTMELLDSGATRLSMLAMDIADPDIKSLDDTYKRVLDQMKRKGIPQERLNVIAKSVKFPSAEAMFDFVQNKFEEHLDNEGIKIEEYNPWLQSTVAIPPLAGGAGRRRSLAKAIYNLNYYQLGIIKSFTNMFKDSALSSISSPIILIVFGLGGGTGSGMAMDFARHLRQAVGSGVPIMGLCVLPCTGDDPPAKGYSAFNAIKELNTLVNREKNGLLTQGLGEVYRNPFNTVMFLPLMPAYSKTGNIMSARDEVDQMIVEMIYVLMDFDMADLMSGIGTEVGLTDDTVHTLSMIKVNYPVDAYVEAFKSNLQKMQQLAEIRKEKLDMLDKLKSVLTLKKGEVSEIYKDYLIKTNAFNAEDFEEKTTQLIQGSPRYDEDQNLYVRGIQDQINKWIDEIIQFVNTIRLVSDEGTIEDSISKLILDKDGASPMDSLEGMIRNISRTHPEFKAQKAGIFERLEQLLPSSQRLTIRQKKLIEDFMNLAEVTERALEILSLYNDNRHLIDAISRRYEILPEEDKLNVNFKDMKSELTTLYHLLQLMIKPSSDEIKMIDEHLTYLQALIVKFRARREETENELIRVEEKRKRKEFDRIKYEKESKGFSLFGKKKYSKEKLREVERELQVIKEDELHLLDGLGSSDTLIDFYNELSTKLEVTSDYRKKLTEVLVLTQDYQDKLSGIMKSNRFYERTSELTGAEQGKIIYKILAEQEDQLNREGILNEILDIDHFKDYMRSIIRIYRTPNIMGVKSSYRSDYLWVTVQTPMGVWDEDLTQELYTALAAYVTGDVGKTITVRIVECRDPWVIRVVVVAGRGRVEDIAQYDEMERLNRKASEFESGLSRSFLVEHKGSLDELLEGLEKKLSS